MRVIAQCPAFDQRHVANPVAVGEYDRMLDAGAEMGLTDIRFSIPWFTMEGMGSPAPAHFLGSIDAYVAAITSRGMGAMPTLSGPTPCWASSAVGKNCSTYQGRLDASAAEPTNWADHRAWITYALNRWDLAGVEIVNEPNHGNNPWSPALEARWHVETRTAVLASTKPATPIVGASLSNVILDPEGDEAAYLDSMYAANASFADSFDLLNFHPYGLDLNTTPWTQVGPNATGFLDAEADHLRAVRDVRDPGKPLMINEMGWTTGDFGGAITPISEQQKADWLVEGLLWQAAQPDFAIAGFFSLFQPFDPIGVSHFGVLDSFGRKTRSWHAVKEAIGDIT